MEININEGFDTLIKCNDQAHGFPGKIYLISEVGSLND